MKTQLEMAKGVKHNTYSMMDLKPYIKFNIRPIQRSLCYLMQWRETDAIHHCVFFDEQKGFWLLVQPNQAK